MPVWKSGCWHRRGGDPLDYFTIIPATVRHDHDLSPLARLIYGDISALARITGVCTATNATIAAENGRGSTATREAIRELAERGHIRIDFAGAGNNGRVITPLSENRQGMTENRQGIDIDPIGKPTPPLSENRQDLAGKPAPIIKKNNKISPISPKGELCAEVVEYLNQRIGSHFRANTKSTARHVSARISEGFTLDDFKAVIDFKAGQWENDPQQSQYLRPDTLFGTKMESYLEAARRSKSEPKAGGDIYAGLL